MFGRLSAVFLLVFTLLVLGLFVVGDVDAVGFVELDSVDADDGLILEDADADADSVFVFVDFLCFFLFFFLFSSSLSSSSFSRQVLLMLIWLIVG